MRLDARDWESDERTAYIAGAERLRRMEPSTSDAVILAVGPSTMGGHVIEVRVSRDAAQDLQQLMEAEGIYDGPMLYAGNVPELVALFASVAGGLHGAAAVLNAFFQRHQGRAVLMERDGTRYELKGMSPTEASHLIERILGEAARPDEDD